jgi:hypothetical protein
LLLKNRKEGGYDEEADKKRKGTKKEASPSNRTSKKKREMRGEIVTKLSSN